METTLARALLRPHTSPDVARCAPADVLAQADQALYQAKSTGRDRVVLAQAGLRAQHHGDEHRAA